MHILERIGAVSPFLDKALGWRQGRSYYRGEQIFRLEMPHPANEKYLPMYNLQQQYIEKFLHDAVAASPFVSEIRLTESAPVTAAPVASFGCSATGSGNHRMMGIV